MTREEALELKEGSEIIYGDCVRYRSGIIAYDPNNIQFGKLGRNMAINPRKAIISTITSRSGVQVEYRADDKWKSKWIGFWTIEGPTGKRFKRGDTFFGQPRWMRDRATEENDKPVLTPEWIMELFRKEAGG